MSNPAKAPERKRLLGNPGRHPIPEPVAFLPAAEVVPNPPEDFGPVASATWDKLWRACSAWISPTSETAIVVRYCETTQMRHDIKQAYEASGPIAYDKNGNVTPSPLLREIRQLDAALLTMECKLAITPADRAKLGLVEVRKASALQSFLAQS